MRALEHHVFGHGSRRLRCLIVLALAILVVVLPTPSRAAPPYTEPAFVEKVCVRDNHGAIIGPCHDVFHSAFPNAGQCTSIFREFHYHGFTRLFWHGEEKYETCLEFMGINKYCADQGKFATSHQNDDGTIDVGCQDPYHHDDIWEQAERIVVGVGEGLVTAAPFVGEGIAAGACLYGQLYACAVLALDVSAQAGLEIPGEVGKAITIAAQVPQCLDGDVVSCAKLGVHGANIVGLDIPGVDKILLGEDVAKCADDDFAACMRLGQAAADASGIDAAKIVGIVGNADDCSSGKSEACIALGQEAAKGTPLGGIQGGVENARNCNAGSTQDCIALGKKAASVASGLLVDVQTYSPFGANACVSAVSGMGPVDLVSAWDDRSATSIAVFPSDGARFTAPFHASHRNGGWSTTAKWVAADFTGDGKTDLLAVWEDNGNNTLTLRQSTQNGIAATHWAVRAGTWSDTAVWLPGDFNGDGHMDIAGAWNDGGQTSIAVFVSDGTKFLAPVQWSQRDGGWGDTVKWAVGDFTGDGKADIAAIWDNGGSNTITIRQSTGSGFAAAHWATNAGGWIPTTVWLAGDYNGDRHLDLAAVWHDGEYVDIAVYPSNGSGFSGWTQWSQHDGGWIDQAKWTAGDFNGDGKTDLASIWNNGGSNTMSVRQSTGSSFTTAHWATNAGGWSPSAAWCVGRFPHSLFDVTGNFREQSETARHDAARDVFTANKTPVSNSAFSDSAVDTVSDHSTVFAAAAAATPPPTVKALGRVHVEGAPASALPTTTMSLCGAASAAAARASPAAPGLKQQCQALGGSLVLDPPLDAAYLDSLAVKGGPIVDADPELSALRARQAGGAGQRGFNIGVAAAGHDTLPGPGKQHIYNSLDRDEKPGYDAAVSFVLERNRR